MPNLIVSCVSVAIAFIPEGLPIALSAGLTITANLMRKQKVLCKSLKTVETLGAVSVICSDKTGTLTEVSVPYPIAMYSQDASCPNEDLQNRMAVTECTIGNHTISVDEAEEEQLKSASPDLAGIVTSAVGQIRAIAGLCNAAEFDAATMHQPIEQRRIYGDATDQAILRFSERLGPVQDLRQCWQKTYELAFNSKNKFMIRTFSLFKPDCLGETLPEAEADAFQPGDM